jgi:ABC-type phosphate/phosphonate transport system substrate-binding protein
VIRLSSKRLLFLAAAAFSLVLVGCTTGADTTSTTATQTTSGETTATTAPVESTTSPVETSTTALEIPVTASDSLDPGVVERIQKELAELMAEAEEVRGLPYLSAPEVVILNETEFSARVAEIIAEDLDEDELAIDSRFRALLGMLPEGADLYGLYIDLYTEGVTGFYDGDEGELVVPAAPDGFTPLQRITVVHELVHALTDQYFDLNEDYTTLIDEGNVSRRGDDTNAALAVLEGDAQRASIVYLESLSPFDAIQAATEALASDTKVFDSTPAWIQDDLLYPYRQGLTFTDAVIGAGGLAGVDETYIDPPTTTEQILDHRKYVVGEGPLDLPQADTDLIGWDIHDERSFGEWGLRLILGESLLPGEATQAAAGWGNDRYTVYARGDDVAIVLHYIGDAERDAEELADAFIAHIGTSMNAGLPVESGGGLLYDQGSDYVFLDRVDDQVFFIASTDKSAGADLRAQLGL